jgi:hypothetical protein
MHQAFFNPFGVPFLLLSPEISWTIFIILQAVLLGVVVFYYGKSIHLNNKAAVFSAIVLLLCGYVSVRLEYGQFIYGYAVLPLLLTIIEAWCIRDTTKKILLIPPIILFLFLSGQPHMIVYVLVLSGIYTLFRSGWKKLLYYILLVSVGVGLAMFQLIPSLELFVNSTIRSAYTSRFIITSFLVPIEHLITIFIPNYFGNAATYNYFGASGDSIETTASIGLIPCFFAFLAVKKNSWFSRFFTVTAVISILLALDWFGAKLFYMIPIPVISAEAPSRFFAITSFAIGMLSGIGIDLWLKNKLTRSYLNKRMLLLSFLA